MDSIDIIGYKREKVNNIALNNEIREKGLVPGILYSKDINRMFSVSAYSLNSVIYSDTPKIINIDIEGEKFTSILKDVQFHPVNESILHIDLKKIEKNEVITAYIPFKILNKDKSVGIKKGGKLIQNLKIVKVSGLYTDIPNYIDIDIMNLEAGKICISDIPQNDKYTIVASNKSIPVVSIRPARTKTE